MSTKIYNGKIMTNMSLLELNNFRKSLRDELIPIAQEQYYRLVAKILQAAYVFASLGNADSSEYDIDFSKMTEKERINPQNMLAFARKEAVRLIEKTSAAVSIVDSEPDADFDAYICVFPLKDKTLAIPFSNNEKLMDCIKKRSELQEYGYWNNSDCPKHLESEWEQRRNDWNAALPGAGVPREHGILLHLIDHKYDIEKHVYSLENITKYFEQLDAISYRIAKNNIVRKHFDELCNAEKKKDTHFGQNSASDYVRILRLSNEYADNNTQLVIDTQAQYMEKMNIEEFFDK